MSHPIAIGIDVGTSGIRAIGIDQDRQIRVQATRSLPIPTVRDGQQEQYPSVWWNTLMDTLGALTHALPSGFTPRALSLDGTSGSLLLTDNSGEPLGPALMYADQRASVEAEQIRRVAPAQSAAHGASAALAKLLWLLSHRPPPSGYRVLHQADWLQMKLGATPGTSDENNALKLGYDPITRRWPEWMNHLKVPVGALPNPQIPGTPVGKLSRSIARALGLPPDVTLVAGTTDGVAAFMATGANKPGEAVTSLGSTLVLKLLCSRPIFQPDAGIYSHRLGDLWLTGGASNTGGAVLNAYFSPDEIVRCTQSLQPDKPTGLHYYPLLYPGERFPVCDPELAPRLRPRPDDVCRFFQGMLEGIADIEALGYQRLQTAGAEALLNVRSVGGGAVNAGWSFIRSTRLRVPMLTPDHQDAAFGTALLALQAL